MRVWRAVLTAGWVSVGIVGCTMFGPQGEPGGSASPRRPAVDLAFEDALEAFKRENHGEAERLLERIVLMDPNRYDARVLLGETRLKTGQVEDALKQFNSTLASEQYKSLALQGIGLSLLRLGDTAQAATKLRGALQLDETLWRSNSALGWINDTNHEWASAETSYKKALAVAPNAAVIHNNLGMSYLLQRRFQEAAVAFRTAIKLEPSLGPAQANLRISLASQGSYDEALAGVPEKAMPDALNDIGYLAMMRGDYENAAAYFSRALKISPAHHDLAARNLEILETLKAAASK